MTTVRVQRTEEEIRKRPINRLQTVYALKSMQIEDYKTMQEAAKEGKPVAWCSGSMLPRHFFYAMGVDDVYADGYGPVLSASGVAPFFLDRCDAEGFPDHMCGYYRATLGYAIRMAELGGQIPPEAPPRQPWSKPTLVLAGLAVCDNHSKGMQAMGRYLDAPCWVGHHPLRQISRGVSRHALMEDTYEQDVKYVLKELREFVAWLERLLGKKMNWDLFEEHLDGTIEVQNLWHEITDEMRKVSPCPMSTRCHYTAITGTLFRTPDLAKAREAFGNMKAEVQYRVDNKISGINRPEKYRVIMGSIPPWHSLGIYEELADRGWSFVREHYHPQRPKDLSWVKDPLEKCVRYWCRSLADNIDIDFPSEEAAEVKEQVKQQGYSNKLAGTGAGTFRDVRTYQADGVFWVPLRGCRPSACGALLAQHQLMEAYKVPSILIPGDHIDARFFDPVDAMKKLEAFEETMDHYKEVRKKEGLEW